MPTSVNSLVAIYNSTSSSAINPRSVKVCAASNSRSSSHAGASTRQSPGPGPKGPPSARAVQQDPSSKKALSEVSKGRDGLADAQARQPKANSKQAEAAKRQARAAEKAKLVEERKQARLNSYLCITRGALSGGGDGARA